MDRQARLLVIIGSGEMVPPMTKVHRSVIDRLFERRTHAGSIKAAMIDTPYGFQSNADALSASTVDYFGRRLGMSTSIASYRRSDDDVLSRETAFARIREADFVFSGPGSPSYALRQWSDSEIPQLLVDKLAKGGALVLASAAALTLGRLTVPVYEIYKAGDDPFWLPGLDVLSTVGINAAVITHYDNAEGGGHDTRFCFLGERKLAALEEQMPEDTFILGVDEHTALLVDLDEERASVRGRGSVTVRHRGRSVVFGTGNEIGLEELRGAAEGARTARAAHPTIARREPAGREGAEQVDVTALVRSVLALEDLASARSKVVQLGEIAERALNDRTRLVEPLIEALLEIRRNARAIGDWATADAIRDRLLALGVEVTDSADGTASFRLPAPG